MDAVVGAVEDAALAAADVAVDAGGEPGVVAGDVEPVFLDVDEADHAPVVVVGVRAGPGQAARRVDAGRQAGGEIELLVAPAGVVGHVGDLADLAGPAARGRIGQDEDELGVVELVRVGVLLEAVVVGAQDGRRALVAPDGEVEGVLDVAHHRDPVGLDLRALVLVVDAFEEVSGELVGQAHPGHAQVPGEEEHRRPDVVLDLGDHLLLDGDLVAPGVDDQGGQDGDQHDRAADEELDHGEPRGPVR